MEEIEKIIEFLRRGKEIDMSEAIVGNKEKPLVLEGYFRRIDLSGARGYVKIVSKFTNLLDASGAQGLYLVLEGKFNIVDASGGKITVDREKAQIIIFDASNSKSVTLEEIDFEAEAAGEEEQEANQQ